MIYRERFDDIQRTVDYNMQKPILCHIRDMHAINLTELIAVCYD